MRVWRLLTLLVSWCFSPLVIAHFLIFTSHRPVHGRISYRCYASYLFFLRVPLNPNHPNLRCRSTLSSSPYGYTTSEAPAAIGPYSQAIKVGDLLFCSGCIPLNPQTMEIVQGGVEEQTKQALKNFKAVVEASGSELGKVAKTTVSLHRGPQ